VPIFRAYYLSLCLLPIFRKTINMNKFYFFLIFCCLSANGLMAQLSPGDVLFTAFRFDGVNGDIGCEDGFAFTPFVDIPANTTIYFTEDEYNGSSFETGEGDISWSHNAVVPAGTVVQLTTHVQSDNDECGGVDGVPSASIGTIQFLSTNWNLGTSNEEIYVYLGALRQPTTWLCALLTDNTDNANVPPVELNGFVMNFTNIDQDADLGIYTGMCNTLSDCKNEILNLNNWTVEDGPGNDCCDADGVDYPDDIPANIPSVITINFEDDFDGGTTATLFLDGQQNGRNRYRSDQMAGAGNLECYWSGTRWEIRDLDQNSIPYFSTFDVSPNPPNLTTGCWESAFGDNLLVFSGDGTAAVNLDFSFTAPNLCSGASSVTLSGGSPPGGSYSGNGVTDNGDGTFTFDPNVAGVGTTTITYGCSSNNATADITVSGELNVNISIGNVSCFGANDGSATANVNSGQAPFSYLWSNGASTASISNLAAGTYSVTVTDGNGCTGTASSSISNPPTLNVSITPSNVSCNGGNDGSASANGTGGTSPYTYQWSNGDAGATASGLSAGTYTVTITDANGCTNTETVTITEPSAISLSFSSTADDGSGNGTASVMAMGGTPNYTYNWNNGGSTATINNLAEGTYNVTVTDANGCEMTGSVVVESSVTVSLTLSIESICTDGENLATNLGGGLPAGGTYSGNGVLDNGDGSTFNLDLSSNTGTVIITYSFNGQSVTDEITVVQNDLEVIYQTNGQNLTVSSLINGSSINIEEIVFDFGDGNTAVGFSNATNTYVSAGTYEVCASATLPFGCDTTYCTNIVINPFLPNEQCPDPASIDMLFHGPQNIPQTSTLFTNVNYTTDASDPSTGFECFFDGSLENSRWFTFIGDGSLYFINTVVCNSTDYIDNGDTQMVIYSGDCSSLLSEACNEDGPDSEPGGPFPAGLEFQTEAGKIYRILIDGFAGADGEFCLQVTNLSPTNTTNIIDMDFELFPNPTTDLVHINGLSPNKIQVIDTYGRLVKTITKQTQQFSIAELPNGLYSLQIEVEEGTIIRKIVKQ
jgi:hypothetical protein